MKVQKILSNVSPFAGISFVNSSFNETGISQLIDNKLGARVKTVGFSYSDIIKIHRSRMDAGSYSKDIINVVASNSKLFYNRADKSAELCRKIIEIEKWKTVEINYKIYEVASISFTQFYEEENYRLVIMREKSDDNQIDMFTPLDTKR